MRPALDVQLQVSSYAVPQSCGNFGHVQTNITKLECPVTDIHGSKRNDMCIWEHVVKFYSHALIVWKYMLNMWGMQNMKSHKGADSFKLRAVLQQRGVSSRLHRNLEQRKLI